jgi:hypothetical protein
MAAIEHHGDEARELLGRYDLRLVVAGHTHANDVMTGVIGGAVQAAARAGTIDEQAALAEEMGLHLAEQVPFQWFGSDLTLIAAKGNVQGLRSWTLPDGTLGDGTTPGATFWSQVWVTDDAS